MLVQNLAILVLAGFVGFAVISKVPNTLHTPLMPGTNAIHASSCSAGSSAVSAESNGDRSVRQTSAADAAIQLAFARQVIVVPVRARRGT